MRKKGIWLDSHTFTEFPGNSSGSLSKEIATRGTSVDYFSMAMMYLPNPDPVLRKTGKQITVYNELLSDPHLGGCVSSRKAGVKSLNWSVDRGLARTKQAKLVEDCFNALDMDRIFSEVLNAPLYGYQPLEVMWEKTPSGWWLPKDVVGKPQHWFNFGPDNALQYRSIDNIMGAPVPPRKFLLARYEATYANPYGTAELGRVFWPITFKRGGMKFWVTFAEKYGMPFILGKLPRGREEKEYQELADQLEAMVQDAVAVVPDDATVTVGGDGNKGATPSSGDIYEKLLDFCKAEVSIAILGQNLTTEVKSGGSFAASKSHMAVRSDIVNSDRKLTERVFNDLIGWIFELNFGEGDRPVFTMFEDQDVDISLAMRDKVLTDTGVKFTPAYYKRTYGLGDDEFKVTATAAAPSSGLASDLNPGAQFSEGATHTYPDQAAIDAVSQGIDPASLQAEMQGVLRPVIDLINAGNSKEEVLKRLAAAYPEMNADDLVKTAQTRDLRHGTHGPGQCQQAMR